MRDDLSSTRVERNLSASSAGLPVPPGTTVAGKYVIERTLGSGGMGVVVAAHHLDLDQRVALKFLGPEAMAQPEAVERLLREARAAARIRSEHVVRVLDVGRLDSGLPYIVMELVEGKDLSQILEESGPLSVDQAVDYVIQACVGLAEAHTAGIVHRDLKPANLLVTQRSDGRSMVKLLDFGISKIDTAHSRNLLTTGASLAMGTPMYMSPEQMKSARDVDQRTDVWALGMVLFELISGRTAFQATTLPEICAKVLSSIPPPALSGFAENSPESLDLVLSRALAKKADERFKNVAEFAQALAPFAGSSGKANIDRVVKTFRAKGTAVPSILPPLPGFSEPFHEPKISYLEDTSSPVSVAPRAVRRRALLSAVVLVMATVTGIGIVGLVTAFREPGKARVRVEQGSESPTPPQPLGSPAETPTLVADPSVSQSPPPVVSALPSTSARTAPRAPVGIRPLQPPSQSRPQPTQPAVKPVPPAAPTGASPDDFGGRK